MTLRHLEIFMAVCKAMSMTDASRQLNMSQPAVSKAVAELEAFYGVKLFERIRRRLYLTEAGSTLQSYAASILDRYEESVSLLREGSVFSVCRLGVNITCGETVLADVCRRIREEDPGLDLRVSVFNSGEIAAMILNNTCDIGLIDRADDPRFETEAISEEEIGLFALDGYFAKEKITAGELQKATVILREKGSGSRMIIDPVLSEAAVSQEHLWECGSDDAILSLAEGGLGIAALPLSYMEKHSSALHRIRYGKTEMRRKLYLVRLRDKYMTKAVRGCMATVREYFSVQNAGK